MCSSSGIIGDVSNKLAVGCGAAIHGSARLYIGIVFEEATRRHAAPHGSAARSAALAVVVFKEAVNRNSALHGTGAVAACVKGKRAVGGGSAPHSAAPIGGVVGGKDAIIHDGV